MNRTWLGIIFVALLLSIISPPILSFASLRLSPCIVSGQSVEDRFDVRADCSGFLAKSNAAVSNNEPSIQTRSFPCAQLVGPTEPCAPQTFCLGAGAALRSWELVNDNWSPSNQCQSQAPASSAISPIISLEALVMSEFYRARPIIEAPKVQPPDGVTLVNLDTNFYSTVKTQDVPLVLVGQPVALRMIPTSYKWQFGDGNEMTTANPGLPYPRGEVTHRYRVTGEVASAVTITFRGEFAVVGGAMRPIDGTISRPSPTTPLRIREARSQLVEH